MKEYYIYKITLLKGKLANHYYYGMHKRDNLDIDPLDDKYYGSGKIVNNYYQKHPFEQGVTAIKEIIEYNDTKEENAQREVFYIGNKWLTDPLCLNLKAGGIGGGGKWTEEQRKKFIAANTGHICADTAKEKISKSNTGKKRTEEAKAKMSAAKKGKPSTFKGKHHTEESKQKNREKKLGKKHTEETKRKMSIAQKGRPHPTASAETRAKISAANKGNTCGHPKAVIMFDADGNCIKEFKSIKDAAIFHGGEKYKGNICMCCNGKLKSACGYKWEYKKVA